MRRLTERQAWAVVAATFAGAPRRGDDNIGLYDVPRRFLRPGFPTGAPGMCGVLTLLELAGRLSPSMYRGMKDQIRRSYDRSASRREGDRVPASFLYPLTPAGAKARVRYAKRQIARLTRGRRHA